MNLGGAIGPILALQVRENLGISYVLVMSSLTSLLLAVATLLFFREPPRPADAPPPKSMGGVLRDMLLVFRNLRFVLFLVIFSGFWVMFWQIFYSLPFYVRDVLKFDRFEIIETVDAWTIILITVPMAALAKKLSAAGGDDPRLRPGQRLLVHHGHLPHPHRCASPPSWCSPSARPCRRPATTNTSPTWPPRSRWARTWGSPSCPSPSAPSSPAPSAASWSTTTSTAPAGDAPQHMWYVVGAIGVGSTILMALYDRLVIRRRPR